MSDPIPLQTPAGFAPAFALGLDDGTGHLALVSDARPLPVMSLSASNSGPAAAPQPLAGETSVSVRVGPFAPAPGRTIVLTLSGEWEGTVRLLRSVDNGVTCHPLTLAGAPWGLNQLQLSHGSLMIRQRAVQLRQLQILLGGQIRPRRLQLFLQRPPQGLALSDGPPLIFKQALNRGDQGFQVMQTPALADQFDSQKFKRHE